VSDLIVARIRRPHGVTGEVLVAVETDRPRHVFRKGRVLYLGGQQGQPIGSSIVLERMRPTAGGAILRLEGVSTREAAEGLRGHVLLIPSDEAAPADADEVRYQDLIGLTALEDGIEIGRVEDILEIEPSPLLVLKSSAGKEILVPFVKEIVQEIDLPTRVVRMKLPEGLLEL
jgi:16S rRNA processing protein RimM